MDTLYLKTRKIPYFNLLFPFPERCLFSLILFEQTLCILKNHSSFVFQAYHPFQTIFLQSVDKWSIQI